MIEGKFVLKVLRGTEKKQYWEEFACDRVAGYNMITVLMEIQRNPITKQGKKVEPVVWEQACLEEVCGSCSVLINAVPRQACTALIEEIIKETGSTVITLAPLSKFPVIRDLVVDRTFMFDSLKKIEGWVPVESLHSEEFGPKISPKAQEAMYVESTCMTCGCCLEACPQFNKRSSFIGPAAINQVKYFNSHPVGADRKSSRLRTMMEKGGVSDCGKAMNCIRVCPKGISLTQSIAQVGRDVTKEYFHAKFGLPENDIPKV